ncbi:dicarboxylate/amino acid:cation symporter [Arthrobacter sp. HMSC08H08]|uniref:dicarboxylate/amino acid:cation symporter n=1 Tax=Arthrobacter sp. HMSC08H08 TaxID=1581143 RepID=UPI0008A1124F|nr:dicarboxylate/amino acid:cation symporter [Arthrobacter sp. HMSC08H08]OFT24341.1 sodium:proton antiporter [Arthrobacter sp. HMSC08H08]
MSVLRRIPLLVWVLLAIAASIAFSLPTYGEGAERASIMPGWLARVFMTYNSLFSGILTFAIPLIILGLVLPAIAELGRGAGKLLGMTAGIAYGSTIAAGLLAYAVAHSVFPLFLGGDAPRIGEASADINPYFAIVQQASEEPVVPEIVLPPAIEVLPALVLAFILGLGLTAIKSNALLDAAIDFRKIVDKLIRNIIIPGLPLFIFGIFMDLTLSGAVGDVVRNFLLVALVALVLTLAVLVLQYLIAGAVAGRSPLRSLWNMRSAYVTALGTASSAASIPVTIEAAKKNKISDPVCNFVIPLCATIHLSGSMVKIVLFSLAVMMLSGVDTGFRQYLPFVLMLGVMMIAAPGVPGGAIAAASGLLGSMLGFNEAQIGLMFATYIALDSFGTAANVTGDGAIAMIVDRLARNRSDNATVEEPEFVEEQ